MIRAIIFDCFGVLYQGSLEHLRDLTPVARRQELDDLSRSSDYGYISYDDYMRQVADLTGKTMAEIEAIVRADHVRNEAMVRFVRSLHGTYKIALLSNVGQHLIDRLFTEQERQELFDVMVLSSAVGMVKPHPEIFELTAQRLGCSPHECLMIDDLASNIAGAAETGMSGVVFTSTQQSMQAVTTLLNKNEIEPAFS